MFLKNVRLPNKRHRKRVKKQENGSFKFYAENWKAKIKKADPYGYHPVPYVGGQERTRKFETQFLREINGAVQKAVKSKTPSERVCCEAWRTGKKLRHKKLKSRLIIQWKLNVYQLRSKISILVGKNPLKNHVDLHKRHKNTPEIHSDTCRHT